MRNGCGGQGGFEFVTLKDKLKKLPFVNPKKLDNLYIDIELQCCNPHDDAFTEGGGIKSFLRANYKFCIDLLTLLHWTLPLSRLILFITTFTGLTIGGYKYFNWMKMNIKEFEKFCNDRNDKGVKELGDYFEDFIYVEHNPGKHKITYLDKFVKVFGDYWVGTCDVDENIGFINDQEIMYISEEYLDFCIKNKLISEDAYYFYHEHFDAYTIDEKESYEDTLIKKLGKI